MVADTNEYKQANATLDLWLGYLITTQLMIRYPSDMIEITERGKGFLKYLLHWGRDADQRNF